MDDRQADHRVNASPAIVVHTAGSTVVVVDGSAVELRPKERAVVAAIAFDHPFLVSVERIAELVWGPTRPKTFRQTIHNHINRIRHQVGELIVTGADGYRFGPLVSIAATPFELDANLGRQRRPAPMSEAFADLFDHDHVNHHRRRAGSLQRAEARDELGAAIEEGRYATAIELAEQLLIDDPFDEQVWYRRALAAAAGGQRRDALQVLARARGALGEVGLLPGEMLATLERSVHDDGAWLLAPDRVSSQLADGPAWIGLEHGLGELSRRLATPPVGQAVAVIGAAGSGKTTLLRAFVDGVDARRWTILRAACDPDPNVPLEPIVDLVEQVAHRWGGELIASLDEAGVLATLSPALGEMIGEPRGLIDRRRILSALRALFAALPLDSLVLIEDIHWAPRRTLEALGAMAAAAGSAVPGQRRALVVAMTSRPEALESLGNMSIDALWTQPWTVEHIDQWLGPIESDATRRREAAGWLLRQSAGVPMFVRELAADLRRRGIIGVGVDGPFDPPDVVPTAIAAALAGRVLRLDRRGKDAIEAAAVLGIEFAADDLAAMLDGDYRAIADLERAGLLVRSDSKVADLRFEHELLHRVVIDRLSPVACAELHDVAYAARAAHQPEATLELARHALGAVNLDRRRAIRSAIEAGHEAQRRWARLEAADWWLQAAALIGGDDDFERWAELCRMAGEQQLHGGDAAAVALLVDVIEQAMQRGSWATAARAAVIVSKLGPTSHAGAPDLSISDLCQRVLAQLAPGAERAALAAASTMLHSLSGETGLARSLFEQATADAALIDDDEVWAEVLPYAYQSMSSPFDLERREQLTAQFADVAERLDREDSRWSAAQLHYSNLIQRGDPRWREVATRMLVLSELVQEQNRDWEMTYLQATIAQLDGDEARSEAMIDASLGYADIIAESRVIAVYSAHLLSLRMWQRRLPELLGAIAQLAETQARIGAWHAAQAIAAAQSGEVQMAVECFDRAVAEDCRLLERDQTYSAALIALGETAIELGDAARATLAGELLIPLRGRWSWSGAGTMGPIDSTLCGLAIVTGDIDLANQLGADASASCGRMAAPGFASIAAARWRDATGANGADGH